MNIQNMYFAMVNTRNAQVDVSWKIEHQAGLENEVES